MRLDCRQLLGLGALVLSASLAQPRNGPNILLVVADDLGWGDVSMNGRKSWRTPNIDRLAREGTRFTRFYSGAAVCNPARACLMTGKYSIHNGVKGYNDDLPSSETTVAEALRDVGYDTALFGKWHRGQRSDGGYTHPVDQGWDEYLGFMTGREAWEHFPEWLHHNRGRADATGFASDIFADAAIEFVSQRRDKPFFVYLAFTEPHSWIEAPKTEVARFLGEFEEANEGEPYNARYAAMITKMDESIGRVLDALDRLSLRDDTLVIFTSDQGATFEPQNEGASHYHDSNTPLRGQKRSLEEGGIRVPGAVRWPARVPSGRSSSEVVHFIDVFPTLMAAAGAESRIPSNVDGANMLAVLEGKRSSPERTLFWEWEADQGEPGIKSEGVQMGKHAVRGVKMYAAMRGDMKLLDINGARYLYDVARDPAERRPLSTEHPELVKSLHGALQEWKATDITN